MKRRRGQRLDRGLLEAIRARVPLSRIVGRYVSLVRRGPEKVGLCPFHSEKTPSFTVRDDKGFFHCFGCGAHGDVIGFVMRVEKVTFPDAVRALARETGLAAAAGGWALKPAGAAVVTRTATQTDRDVEDRARRTRIARRIWDHAQPIAGTPAEAYLRGRGLHLDPWPAALRFAPELRHGPSGRLMPAMVAAVQDAAGAIVAVHRTYLARRPDGACGKAPVEGPKRLLGPAAGGAVRLWPADALEAAPPLPARIAVTEGIETGLSVAQALHELAVWAALSAPMIARLRPPRTVREVILCPDGDEAGRAAAERAVAQLLREGRRVRIAAAPPGRDYNDLLKGAA